MFASFQAYVCLISSIALLMGLIALFLFSISSTHDSRIELVLFQKCQKNKFLIKGCKFTEKIPFLFLHIIVIVEIFSIKCTSHLNKSSLVNPSSPNSTPSLSTTTLSHLCPTPPSIASISHMQTHWLDKESLVSWRAIHNASSVTLLIESLAQGCLSFSSRQRV